MATAPVEKKKDKSKKRVVNVEAATPQCKRTNCLQVALHGLLTSPNAIWFELTTGDEDLDNVDNVRKWLQASARKMHNVLNNSNFQTEITKSILTLPAWEPRP